MKYDEDIEKMARQAFATSCSDIVLITYRKSELAKAISSIKDILKDENLDDSARCYLIEMIVEKMEKSINVKNREDI